MSVPSHAPGFALPGVLDGGRVEIVDDRVGVAPAIAAKLRHLGVDATVVERATAEASGVVFAAGLARIDAFEDAVAIQRAALASARAFAASPIKRFFATLQDTGGDFGFAGRGGVRAWSAGLAGLAKTAAAEWPDASAKTIDVERAGATAEAVAARVVEELLLGGVDVEVGLESSGRRTVVRHVPAPYATASGPSPIRRGTVVVVSGGARGVTAASLRSIAGLGPHLALLGRTKLVDETHETRGAATDADIRRVLLARAKAAGAAVLPKELAREAKAILDCREIRDNMAALEKAGARVSYHAVDVRSADSVRSAVDGIRKASGPIGAIVHGAGVLADALVGAQTDEQLDLVFGTKVHGLHHLLDATRSDPVEALVVFSSVAGRFGNSAQSAYSMANEVLSAVAAGERARRGSRCVVRSLAWGPWAGGMVTPGLAKLFEKAGVQLIPIDAGTAALGLEMRATDAYPQVVLMNGLPPAPGMPLHGGRAPAAEARFELRVNASTQPLLDGHRIRGAPVIPAVMALGVLARAAGAVRPGQRVTACRGLRVLPRRLCGRPRRRKALAVRLGRRGLRQGALPPGPLRDRREPGSRLGERRKRRGLRRRRLRGRLVRGRDAARRRCPGRGALGHPPARAVAAADSHRRLPRAPRGGRGPVRDVLRKRAARRATPRRCEPRVRRGRRRCPRDHARDRLPLAPGRHPRPRRSRSQLRAMQKTTRSAPVPPDGVPAHPMPAAPATLPDAPLPPRPGRLLAAPAHRHPMEAQHERVVATHTAFLQLQEQVHADFLASRQRLLESLGHALAHGAPPATDEADDPPVVTQARAVGWNEWYLDSHVAPAGLYLAPVGVIASRAAGILECEVEHLARLPGPGDTLVCELRESAGARPGGSPGRTSDSSPRRTSRRSPKGACSRASARASSGPPATPARRRFPARPSRGSRPSAHSSGRGARGPRACCAPASCPRRKTRPRPASPASRCRASTRGRCRRSPSSSWRRAARSIAMAGASSPWRVARRTSSSWAPPATTSRSTTSSSSSASRTVLPPRSPVA